MVALSDARVLLILQLRTVSDGYLAICPLLGSSQQSSQFDTTVVVIAKCQLRWAQSKSSKCLHIGYSVSFCVANLKIEGAQLVANFNIAKII